MDTIAAIATAHGSAGVGIVRISGPNAKIIIQRLFAPVHGPNSDKVQGSDIGLLVSHRLQHGYIHDPATNHIVDEVLVVLMTAPHSYTREDVVEIQSHSGYLILQKILELALTNGARLADPGEFTRRAFLNGRIDLSQAEAVMDMIYARSERGLRLAANQLNGEMKHQVDEIISRLNQYCVELSACIEFPDDMEDHSPTPFNQHIVEKNLIAPLRQLLDNYQDAHFYRDGLRLSIVGRPNVGKSSLFNRLAMNSKAIVTPYPGTTRDPVETYVQIEGIPTHITDTAGLHVSPDPIEQIGMDKTRDSLSKSDLILLILEADRGMIPEDNEIYQDICDGRVILVYNKIDLISNGNDLLFVDHPCLAILKVSALTGLGIDELKSTIAKLHVSNGQFSALHENVPTLRQKQVIEKTLGHLTHAVQGLEFDLPEDLVLHDLELARNELQTITGNSVSRELLDDIFGQFCIGK